MKSGFDLDDRPAYGMETSNLGNSCTLVASLYKSNWLLPNSVICSVLEVSPGVPHTVVIMNKLEPKKLNYDHRWNYSQPHSYTLDRSWASDSSFRKYFVIPPSTTTMIVFGLHITTRVVEEWI